MLLDHGVDEFVNYLRCEGINIDQLFIRFNKLLEILASQSGNLLNIAELCNTCGLARQTIEGYLFILEQTYILRLVRPFNRNLRAEVTKTPKVFFYDSGLMQLLWLKQMQKEMLGSVFETSVFAELTKIYGSNKVNYWRTTDKKEIDFVINLPDNPVPIEVKSHFPRVLPVAFKSFWRNGSMTNKTVGYVVGLYGERTDPRMIYPWQIV